MAELLSLVTDGQAEYLRTTSAAYRKQRGQVFTPAEIARFMAGLFRSIPATMRVLDPGAGAGSLSVALCERVLQLRSPRRVELHLFETEPSLVDFLCSNLEHCRKELARVRHRLDYTVHQEDFVGAGAWCVAEQRTFLAESVPGNFDVVVMNPPYFKVRKDSEHARLMDCVVHGQPNAYAFFLAIGASLLKPGGELVAITPRSFCGGLYFRGFRKWFFQRMSLEHIHLFESRTEAFKESDVLQESVITKSRKSDRQSVQVTVTGSYGKELNARSNALCLSANEILGDSSREYSVRIPVNEHDCTIMRAVEALPHRFEEVRLRISTGPVVTFRAREFLLQEKNGQRAVPLLMPHNIKPFRTVWPVTRKRHPVYILDTPASRRRRLLVPAANYVLLKRFSAKEEKRRLTAACLLRRETAEEWIGLENHLNYVYHADRELTEEEVYGIAALFNSVLIDRYFRLLSGNTQVNATDIRNLPFPSPDVLAAIGTEVLTSGQRDALAVERMVLKHLGIERSLFSGLVGRVP